MMDALTLRHAFGHFATGVTVVTTRCPEGKPQGVTANSFSSLSLDPPLILVSLAKSLTSLPHFRVCRSFAIHLLGLGQQEVSRRFATRGGDKWAGVDVQDGIDGLPLLPERLGLFECERHAVYDGGDHEILLGRVLRHDVQPGGAPLIFFKGAYHAIEAQRGQDAVSQERSGVGRFVN